MKKGADSFVCDADREGMGCSEASSERVSAPTMPPIECPIRITCTEGSMVGEGVELATSMSITLFWSLSKKKKSTLGE